MMPPPPQAVVNGPLDGGNGAGINGHNGNQQIMVDDGDCAFWEKQSCTSKLFLGILCPLICPFWAAYRIWNFIPTLQRRRQAQGLPPVTWRDLLLLSKTLSPLLTLVCFGLFVANFAVYNRSSITSPVECDPLVDAVLAFGVIFVVLFVFTLAISMNQLLLRLHVVQHEGLIFYIPVILLCIAWIIVGILSTSRLTTAEAAYCRAFTTDQRDIFDMCMADVALTYLSFWYMIYLSCGILGVNPPQRTHARPTRTMAQLVPSSGSGHQGRGPQVGISINQMNHGNGNNGPGSGFAIDGSFGDEIHHHHYVTTDQPYGHSYGNSNNNSNNGIHLPVYGQQALPSSSSSSSDGRTMNHNHNGSGQPGPPGGATWNNNGGNAPAEGQPLVNHGDGYGGHGHGGRAPMSSSSSDNGGNSPNPSSPHGHGVRGVSPRNNYGSWR